MRSEEEYSFACPRCWQTIEITLDLSAGNQRYIQDCEVCCNPYEISYEVCDGVPAAVTVTSLEQ